MQMLIALLSVSLLHHLRHSLLGRSHSLGGVLVVLQFPGEVGVVGSHIEVTMTGQVEENDALFPFLLGLECFLEDCTDSMSRLWRGNNAFAAGKLNSRLKDGILVVRLSLDDSFLMEQGDQ